MKNYFEFYGLKEQFFIDQKELKSLFLQKSKEFHPDFHRNDAAKYEEALEISSVNNVAFKTLSKQDMRIAYILRMHGLLEEGKSEMPQAFLFEMMEVNEAIMDLKMDYDEAAHQKVVTEVDQISEELEKAMEQHTVSYDEIGEVGDAQTEILKKIKEIYLKQKYVLRIKESLNTFAPL